MKIDTKNIGIIGTVITTTFLLFAFSNNWIIIRLPQSHTKVPDLQRISKKRVTLWFWHHNRWQHENSELLWSANPSLNITQLMNGLLALFDEEQLLPKKTTLQSVTLNALGTCAFISFDRTPLDKQSSIHTKWMMIESIIKTIRENKIPIQSLQFLSHHQPMHDMHLDFSHPWPISGFL